MPRGQNISNLKTEKVGISFLKESMVGFMVPTKEERVKLYDICNIEYRRFYKSIDGVKLLVPSIQDVKSSDDFLLIEVKVTAAKNVTRLPFRVFFGFTQNEEELFKSLTNYRLCIVHTGLREFYSLKYAEYLDMIHRKRVQYQIDFRAE